MKKIDWSNPFLQPVILRKENDKLYITAQSETIVFTGKIININADCDFYIEEHFANGTLNPVVNVKSDGIIKEYGYFDGEFGDFDEIVCAKTDFTGICAFLRKNDISFFLSLDFPYSKIVQTGNNISISVDPLDEVKAGEKYLPHTLTIGACRLVGKKRGAYDIGEIEGFSAYIKERMPKNFRGEKPIYSTTCITNRMTDPREGRVFYSMYDNPTLTLDPETLKEEVKLCDELGIEYYQVFEGFFDWEEDGSSEKALQEIMKLAIPKNIKVGDYMTALELNCWHYNYHDRCISDPSMCVLLEEDYKSGKDTRSSNRHLCYGCKKTVDFLKNTIVKSIKRNNEGMICLDGDAIYPCYDESHGHNPGSLYALVRGFTEFMASMNETNEHFLTWSNAGNWLQLMPKLLWYNQNVYLTDPHPRNYSSALNALFYLGSCRREQMVTVHNKYFVPYSAFSNCEYYFSRHSRIDDEEFFEYSFLQGLAVTPNICLGEMRTFFERTSSKRLPYVKSFIKKWLSYIRDNIDCWNNVYQLGDSPETGANEIYAHINGDHGIICLVNQNQSTQTAHFSLDGSIGLIGKINDRFLLEEIYPRECPIAEQPLPGPLYGDSITLDVPAFSVRFVKISPYNEPENIRLYGIPGKISDLENITDVNLKLNAEISEYSGCKFPAAIYIGNKLKKNCFNIKNISIKTAWNVPKYIFESKLSDVSIDGDIARFNITMPREYFSRELADWSVDGSEPVHLHQDCSDFCGAYIHNLYRETQKAVLTIEFENLGNRENCIDNSDNSDNSVNSVNSVKSDNLCFADLKQAPEHIASLPAPSCRRGHIYESKLNIPFIEWPGCSMGYGLDEVIEFVFCDCNYFKELKVFINNNEMKVYEYSIPQNRNMRTFYVELTNAVGSGTVSDLRVEVKWDENTHDTFFTEKKSKGGAQILGS